MKRPEQDLALVVDDTPGSLTFLTDALEEAGFAVLVATDGASALTLADRVTPDVVLMDAVMPGLDGFETCAALKARESFEHVPVIFMTGLTETEHVIKGLNAGCVDYVTKPIVPEEMIARMRVHLANARRTSGARLALDATGRHLVAVDAKGEVLWMTSQAGPLLQGGTQVAADGSRHLPPEGVEWLSRSIEAGSAQSSTEVFPLAASASSPSSALTFVARIGTNEFLLRLVQPDRQDHIERIKENLPLTLREAEVLVWLARGKSNRDIATILRLSPRTVDKHLEQVYSKIGVENRVAAVGVALRILVSE